MKGHFALSYKSQLTVADRESGVAGADLLREMGGGRMQLEGRRM